MFFSREEKFPRSHFVFSYYLFAVGSRSNGYLKLGVQARMHETTLTAGVSSLVANEIQGIAVRATVVSEQQVRRINRFLY